MANAQKEGFIISNKTNGPIAGTQLSANTIFVDWFNPSASSYWLNGTADL